MVPLIEEINELDDEVLLLQYDLRGADSVPSSSAAAAPDYSSYDVARLERTLKARKQQVGFLQKSLEKKANAQSTES